MSKAKRSQPPPPDEDDNSLEKTNIFTHNTVKIEVEPNYQVPPCLVLLVGPTEQMGRQWIIDQPAMTIGRSSAAEVQFGEISLSKEHARIDVIGAEVFITDLGSTNQTLIDNKALTPNQRHRLKNNEQIRTGS